ncbi:MAG TPA: GNAT family N-acetyltransferase [Chitinophagaceae bacterium]|nr:GNAT family N-acetyltransferase [Chitinophagaceae bacterium]
MTRLRRTDATDPDFIKLVRQLDADLAARDGADHQFYAGFNTLGNIKHAVLAYEGEEPVGCGAIKHFNEEAMEVKRMYTLPAHRGKGIAGTVLQELERWAAALGYPKCVLETGKRQPEAIRLYLHHGFTQIPNYGQYAGVENSCCFEKVLVPASTQTV